MQKCACLHASLLRPPRPDRLEHCRPAAGPPRHPAQSNGPRAGGQCGDLLGDLFAREGRSPAQVDYVSSPLSRARETMEIMRATLAIAPSGYEIEARLTEISFGEWEG